VPQAAKRGIGKAKARIKTVTDGNIFFISKLWAIW
jgi:hypothetical protein